MNNPINNLNDIMKNSIKENSIKNAMIELNTLCNFSCIHCYHTEHIHNGLSFDNVKFIVDRLQEIGCYEITLTGGEIFLHPNIMGIIKYIRKKGLNVILFTNGSLIKSEQIKELSNLYITLLSLTVFSLEEDINDNITQCKNSIVMIKKNILELLKYNIPFEIKTMILKENENNVDSLIKYCKNNDIPLKFDYSIFKNRKLESTTQDHTCNYDTLKKYLLVSDQWVGYSPINRENSHYMCAGVQNGLFINSFGKVFGCVRLSESYGNILKDSLDTIINNKQLLKIRELKWDYMNQCKSCKYSEYCVPCPATAYEESGSYYGKDVLACRIAKARKEIYEKVHS